MPSFKAELFKAITSESKNVFSS